MATKQKQPKTARVAKPVIAKKSKATPPSRKTTKTDAKGFYDARLIALAATTAKLSGETGISPEVLYALARVGLPTAKQQLAYVSTGVMEQALQNALAAGIVQLDKNKIAKARTAFEKFAKATRAGRLATLNVKAKPRPNSKSSKRALK